jgi:hypothetical protein
MPVTAAWFIKKGRQTRGHQNRTVTDRFKLGRESKMSPARRNVAPRVQGPFDFTDTTYVSSQDQLFQDNSWSENPIHKNQPIELREVDVSYHSKSTLRPEAVHLEHGG